MDPERRRAAPRCEGPLGGQRSTRSDKRGGLVLFDLDHTLLHGDSDVLWCDFLMDRGILPRESFAARNADMDARYQAGTVGVEEFANFYVGTLAGRGPAQWEPYRQAFLAERVVPRIPASAMALVRSHLDAGDLVAMTTATNRYITELTAMHFGIEHLLATEPELEGGIFSGRTTGTLNMRQGKVLRLQDWMQARGLRLEALRSRAYSDSINDLPLLEAVEEPVAVSPDARLERVARERGWEVIALR
ncbi:MAG TPA: HAD-IB family hydrolase [Ramlibacter sp.]|nr:HAD-IB family hydrolase [Ramlibacter sp.]